MQISKLNIQRYGDWSDLRLDALSDGLNVIFSGRESGKASVAQFLRSMLFGFDDRLSFQHDDDSNGSIGIDGPFGKQTVRRHDRRHMDDIVTIENLDGTVTDERRLSDYLGGVERSDFDRVFGFGARNERNVDHLIDGAITRGYELVGGDDASTRLRELQKSLFAKREDLAKLPHVQTSLDQLEARQRRLREDIEGFSTSAYRYRETRDQRLTRLALEIGQLEDRLEHLHEELISTESTLQRHRDEYDSLRHEPVIQTTPLGVTEEQRDELRNIDAQLANWTTVLEDITERISKLKSITDKRTWNAAAEIDEVDPRKYLRRLESRIDELQSRLQAPIENENWQAQLWDDARSEFSESLKEMRDDVYRLCRHLNYWQTDSEHVRASSELSHLERCESELRYAIDQLSARRQRLVNEIGQCLGSDTTLLDPAHDSHCVCEDHVSLDDISVSVPLVTQLNTDNNELLAEIHRLDDAVSELRHEIEMLNRQLATAKQERLDLENELIPDYDSQLEEKQRELRVVERQILDVRSRAELTIEVERLETEIRNVKETNRQPLIVREASDFLSQLTAGYLNRIRVSAERTVWTQTASGTWLAFDQLEDGRKDQVYLSLCMALTTAYGRSGIRLPMILDEPFSRLKTDDVTAAVRLLKEFAERGRQVFVFTSRSHIANQFRSQNVDVRNLPGTVEIKPEITKIDVTETVNRQLDQAYAEEFEPETIVSFVTSEIEAEDVEPVDAPDQYFLWETSPIEDAPSIDAVTSERFREIGIAKVGDLLSTDADDLVDALELDDVNVEMVRRWQGESNLSCYVPRLRQFDARVLVACGITDPEQLAYIHPDELRGRVRALATTSAGRLVLRSGNRYELSRVADWIRSARRYHGRSDSSSSSSSRSSSGNSRSSRSSNSSSSRGSSRSSSSRSSSRSRSRRSDRESRSRRERSSNRGERNFQVRHVETETESSDSSDQAGWKHYLDLSDPVEEAPSIGPKTAERLEAVGIATVEDLLNADCEAVAEQLNHKRITAEIIERWQQQTALCCRIPELRGHDAQILVACEITDTEELSSMDPHQLWGIVEPFAKTTEGKRIIRGGKKPDLEEIENWITWAGHARSLNAA